MRALLRAFGLDVRRMVGLKVAQLCVGFTPPVLLARLLQLLNSDTPRAALLGEGLLLSVALFAVALTGAFLLQHFYWQGVQVALKVRPAMRTRSLHRCAALLSCWSAGRTSA